MGSDRTETTVVLVPGAHHGSQCFDHLVASLSGLGVRAIATDTPGHGSAPGPLTDLVGDASEVRRRLDAVAGPMILVGHSYGGSVITVAAHGHPRVRHLVYLAACMPEAGETVGDILDHGRGSTSHGAPDDPHRGVVGSVTEIVDGRIGRINPAVAAGLFYNDCTPEVQRLAVADLGLHDLSSFTQVTPVAAWHDIPSTYVLCTLDAALDPAIQRWLAAERAGEMIEMETGHSPFLSKPDELAQILAAIVAATDAR